MVPWPLVFPTAPGNGSTFACKRELESSFLYFPWGLGEANDSVCSEAIMGHKDNPNAEPLAVSLQCRYHSQ